ncbi:MAG TPA: hypothetical protein EYH34_08485 [Planctomycetes bacterium]|nr:hypothetical protein [Planctomycetota bacterium]
MGVEQEAKAGAAMHPERESALRQVVRQRWIMAISGWCLAPWVAIEPGSLLVADRFTEHNQ